MYVAKDSSYKQLVREYLYDAVVKHVPKITQGSLLTLSNTALFLENKLMKYFNHSICLCYERDRETYKKLKKLVNRGEMYTAGIIPVYGDVFEIDDSLDYSFVWLDFCNSYTDEFMTKIVELVSKLKFTNKAVLSVTLARSRGNSDEQLNYGKFYKNYKNLGFAQHMLQFLPNVTEITRVQYKCADVSCKAMPMNVFNFFIDKTTNDDSRKNKGDKQALPL